MKYFSIFIGLLVSKLSPQFIKRMKLLTLLMVIGCLHLTAGNTYSQTKRLDLNLKNTNMKELFETVDNQSDFSIFYKVDDLDLNNRFDYVAEKSLITEILDDVLSVEEASNLTYDIENNVVVIYSKDVNQDKVIVSGTVTDENGAPIAGVNIIVKGTQSGASSGMDGEFSLNVPTGSTLILSFLGYKTEEIIVTKAGVLNVEMKPANTALDEVLIVGYGTQKRENASGAISQVGSERFEDRAVPDMGKALQGVVPNLNVTVSSGSPNATPDINVRGFESINGGSPLMLVDGVPFSTLSELNPEDIASVTVLKDAASAAIYGARAAFGVILVTTKSGKTRSRTTAKFSVSTVFSKPLYLPNSLNSLEAVNAANLARSNKGSSAKYTDAQVTAIENYRNDPVNNDPWIINSSGAYLFAGDYNVYDEAYANYSLSQTYNFSLSGGGDKSRFYASAGYVNDSGVWKVNPDIKKRYNTLFKYNYGVTDWMDIDLNVGYNKSEYDEPHVFSGTGSYWHAIDRTLPFQPIVTPAGFPEGEGLATKHNVNYQRLGGRTITDKQQTNLTGNITLRPIENLDIHLNYTHRNKAQQKHDHQQPVEMINDNTPETPFYGQSSSSYVIRTSSISTQNILDLFGSYSLSLNDSHNFKVMAGYNQTSSEYLYIYTKGVDLIKDNTPALSLVNGEDTMSDVNSFTALRGAFGRFNYNYKSKYFVEVNARYDGSYIFPADNRFGLFPSISGAWTVSKENFFREVPVVSFLKLRASYGSLGNQSVSSDLFRPLMGTTAAVGYIIDGSQPMSINAAGLVSSELTWETSTTRNFGFDLGLFEDKFTANVDIYTRVVSDMIVAGQPLPGTLGTDAPQTNAADLETKGFEVEFGWRDSFDNGISYGVKGNISDSRAFITKYDLNPTNLISSYRPDYEIGEIWGLETVGIFQTDEEAAAAPSQAEIKSTTWQAGDIQYADLDGDGSVGYGEYTTENPGDRRVIGNGRSRYNYGFSGSVSYKGFDLDLFFRGVGKKDVFISDSAVFYWGHSASNNNISCTGTEWALENSWTPENPDAKLPIYKNNSNYNMKTQTRFLESGAYLRLKSVNLGYSFSKEAVESIGLQKARVFVSGENLWTKDNLYGIYDPEVIGNSGSTNGKIYPNRASFSCGVQITL